MLIYLSTFPFQFLWAKSGYYHIHWGDVICHTNCNCGSCLICTFDWEYAGICHPWLCLLCIFKLFLVVTKYNLNVLFAQLELEMCFPICQLYTRTESMLFIYKFFSCNGLQLDSFVSSNVMEMLVFLIPIYSLHFNYICLVFMWPKCTSFYDLCPLLNIIWVTSLMELLEKP